MQNPTNLYKLIGFTLLAILIACQNSNDRNWVTFESKDGSTIDIESVSQEITPNSSSQTHSSSTMDVIPKPNNKIYPKSNFMNVATWLNINQFLSEQNSIRTTAEKLEYEGFDLELHYPYPRQSLRLESNKGTFSTTVTKSGNYHVAALIYDGAGTETFELTVNNNIIGDFTADADNNREYLFITNEHFKLDLNDEIAFSSNLTQGSSPGSFSYLAHRVEEIAIIPSMTSTPNFPDPYLIKNIKLNPLNNNSNINNNNLNLTWITNWQTKCLINLDFGPNDETIIYESNAWNNHRISLEKNISSKIKRLKLTCPTEKGEITSTWITPPESLTYTNARNYSITFSVNNNSNLKYTKTPVIVSLPIEKSKWWINSFSLIDDQQNKHLFQHKPLAYWEDGSIKWLLIEFLTTIKANKEKSFQLVGTKTSSEEHDENICIERADSIILNNQKIKVNLTPSSFPFDSIYFDNNLDGVIQSSELTSKTHKGGIVSILSNTGYRHDGSGSDTKFEIIRNGPIACLVSVTNSIDYAYETKIESDFELELYKDQNWIGLNHTIGFNTTKDKIIFKSIDLDIPIEKQFPINWEIGTDQSSYRSTNQDIQLLQTRDNRWILQSDDAPILKGQKSPGWARINFKNYYIKLSADKFWQQWPKSISINNQSLQIGLFPKLNQTLTTPSDNIELTKLLYYFDQDNYVMPNGLRKTQKLTLSFGNQTPNNSKELKLHGRVKPSHTIATKVIGGVESFNINKFPFYGSIFNEMLNYRLISIKENQEYGILNFGDWWGEREVNWGNNEYDTPHGLFQNWLLGGPDTSFELAETAVIHMKNIDVVNYGNTGQIGKMYKHSIGHLGDWFTAPIQDEKVKKGSYSSQHTSGHTWIDGLLDHYYLTGDISSFSTAIEIADNLARYETINYDYTTAREIGSFLLIMTSAYKSTNDEFYINAATIAFNRLIARENTLEGGWDRLLTSYECDVNPPKLGEKSFMTGLLLSGLKQYHIITKNSKASEMIIAAATRLVNENWNNDLVGFKYSACENSLYPTDLNWAILEGLGYSWELTDNLKFAYPILQNSMLMEAFRDGKGFSLTTRFAQQILYHRFQAQNNLYNVYSENNINFRLRSSTKQSVILFSSNNTEKDNFSITISNNKNNFKKTLQIIDGFGSTILTTDDDIEYQIQINSRDKSGINVLSNSSVLNLDADDGVVLLGQKATRTFWLNLPQYDTSLSLDLHSSEPVSIKLIDSNETLIEKCNATACQLTLDTKTDNIKNSIRLEIQNNSDATLNITGVHALLSAFKN